MSMSRFRRSAALAISILAAGAIATATYWYEIDGQRVTLEGSDATHASYSRGVGSVTS